MRFLLSLLFVASLAVCCQSEIDALEKKSKNDREKAQHRVDKILRSRESLSFNDIGEKIKEARIEDVVVVQQMSEDLLQFKQALEKNHMKVHVIALGPLDKLKPAVSKLKAKKNHTLVIDFYSPRLIETSQSYTVAVGEDHFTLEGLQVFQAPSPGRARKQRLNGWILEREGKYRSPFMFSEFLNMVDVKAVATGFYGVSMSAEMQELLLPPALKNESRSDEMWKTVTDAVSGDFDILSGILHETSLPVYLLSSSEGFPLNEMKTYEEFLPFLRKVGVTLDDLEKMDFGSFKSKCVVGKKLILAILARRQMHVTEVFAYDPRNYQNPDAYKNVNPKAEASHKMPKDKTFHLESVRTHAGLEPENILFIDDNLQFCQSAAQQGYLALHVKIPRDASKRDRAFQWPRLEVI